MANRGSVLVVDDQRNMRTTTALLLRDEGYEVADAGGVEEAVVHLGARPFDVVLTDLKMEPHDGLEMLRRSSSIAPSTQVIVMTAYGTIESAVEAMRRGAFDYVAKPFQVPELLIRVEKAVERRRLLSQMSLYAEDFRRLHGLSSMVGQSEIMRKLGQQIARAASSDATVLILGESGTGKELVARALHALSKRCDKAFVAVNCAAMTETLLDSELFGHAKGAFTGAIKARRGLFEEADGGTLFIDEVTETTLAFQAKLLRAIQEHEIRRIGESQPIKIDVRLVTATNQDLQKAVAEKRFREDLYYRLAVVPLKVPPLRDRIEDVPLLATHFLTRYNTKSGTKRRLTADSVQHLCSWHYPGNVRELENAIERGAALAESDELHPRDFPFVPAARNAAGGTELLSPAQALQNAAQAAGSGPVVTLAEALDNAEKTALLASLARNTNDLMLVARELGISSTTLWRKMKHHNLPR
ncbi:MAG: sigma-54 dependent transcriptional regulator [Myxococcales bacterium]